MQSHVSSYLKLHVHNKSIHNSTMQNRQTSHKKNFCTMKDHSHTEISERAMSLKPSSRSSPPWEALLLVARYLDPQTLATASCVCKSWFTCMSSDQHWKPLCYNHYSSLFNLRISDSAVSYCRLFSLGFVASKRRLRSPSKPHLSLKNLIFSIDVKTHDSDHIVTVSVPGEDLVIGPNGLFQFDINVQSCTTIAFENKRWNGLSAISVPREEPVITPNGLSRFNINAPPYSTIASFKGVKITWNIVLKGWRGVFNMMDCEGKVSFVPGAEGWFSQELPPPGCCSSEIASGLVADLRLGFCSESESDGMVRLEKVGVGLLSVVSWRYVGVDDTLRYLQHFLVPCDV